MAPLGNDLSLGVSASGRHIVLPADRRTEHVGIFGVTGSGKSRYIESLIRQDLRAWPSTQCGVLLIDPHGSVYDSIMAWVAATKRHNLPIIPIDFSRPDQQIIGYNVLRQRKTEPSVIIDTFVRAIANVWGAAATDTTPLFERWSSNILHNLYDERKTLADAAHLFDPNGLVKTEHIRDSMVRNDWLRARRNRKDFETDTSSTVNRFRRFLLNPMLRSMFGQTESSLDFGKALDEGSIILVSLARKGGTISRENADLLATLMLADLWAAAEERGKSDTVKPFYVYADEFARFLTPTMADNLAESRGYGIGMHLATQFPRQILNGGPHGVRIFDEVMENTRTKVVFRLRTRANLQPLAESLFMDCFDPEQVKHQHYSTKVLGHQLAYLPSFGRGTTDTEGGGAQQSHTAGSNRSRTVNWNHTDSNMHTLGTNHVHTDSVAHGATAGEASALSIGTSASEQWNEGVDHGITTGSEWSEGEGTTDGGSRNRSRSVNVAHDLGKPTDELKARLTKGDRRPNYHDLVANSDGYLDDATKKVGVSEALGTGDGDTWGISRNKSCGGNESESRRESRSKGGSRGNNQSLARTTNAQVSVSATSADSYGENESFGEGTADSYGGSETDGTNEADTTGTNSQWSRAATHTMNLSPMLFPITGTEADAPMFRSIEEQIFVAMSKIAKLKNRSAYVLAGDMETPELIRTPDVDRPDISSVCTDLCIGWFQRESGLALPLQEALRRVSDRDKTMNVVAVAIAADADFEQPTPRLVSVVVKSAKHI